MSTQTQDKEELLATDLQLVSLLKSNPDILLRHPELVAELEVPHQSGAAVSLVEKQVKVLRENLKKTEKRMIELMDIAKSNDRLAQSRHRLAINLLNAHDFNDVVSTVDDELSNELKADFVSIKLLTNNEDIIANHQNLIVDKKDEVLQLFATMMKHKNPMCGRCSVEQKDFLFGEDAATVKSAAVVPLSAGAELGLIGLGSKDETRFQRSMGTDFLIQIGELISASVALHIEK